ncbi:hypothetical protein PUN28_011644 [Cardiocondyla obscurior]|uniref:Uncharacterized protein n=1 Tax=Cardiocondyla obscurior TaxID=286306 RepID=A0AAW2FKN4_9HYME
MIYRLLPRSATPVNAFLFGPRHLTLPRRGTPFSDLGTFCFASRLHVLRDRMRVRTFHFGPLVWTSSAVYIWYASESETKQIYRIDKRRN